MKSPVIKRSIVIAGHKTSVSLEDAFWKGLKEIAVNRHFTLSDLVASIDSGRPHGNLSSAIRLFVLSHYQAGANGHDEAHPNGHGHGHGNSHGAVESDQASHHDLMLGTALPPSVFQPE
jgi:predicted DNA-binding ribbon-helix-helix protein